MSDSVAARGRRPARLHVRREPLRLADQQAGVQTCVGPECLVQNTEKSEAWANATALALERKARASPAREAQADGPPPEPPTASREVPCR